MDRLLASIAGWSRGQADIQAVALVGSWARGTAGPTSDVDVVILTTDPSRYLETDCWALELGIASFIGKKSWGALTERRALTSGGVEVEFGFALPSWANADPPDMGTMRVVSDGMRVLHDPHGLLARLTR